MILCGRCFVGAVQGLIVASYTRYLEMQREEELKELKEEKALKIMSLIVFIQLRIRRFQRRMKDERFSARAIEAKRAPSNLKVTCQRLLDWNRRSNSHVVLLLFQAVLVCDLMKTIM